MSLFFIAELRLTLELRTQQPACVRRRRFSQLLQKRGKDGFKASKLHNSIVINFFLLRVKECLFFVDVESQRHRRASFFWDWCKLFLENKCFCCLLLVYVTFWCNNSVITCSYFMYTIDVCFFYCRTQTNFGVVWFGESSFLVFLS